MNKYNFCIYPFNLPSNWVQQNIKKLLEIFQPVCIQKLQKYLRFIEINRTVLLSFWDRICIERSNNGRGYTVIYQQENGFQTGTPSS